MKWRLAPDRPKPWWFSLVRMASVVGALLLIGADPVWRDVAAEASAALTQMTKLIAVEQERVAKDPAATLNDSKPTNLTTRK